MRMRINKNNHKYSNMVNLEQYRKRFYNLMESTMGDVKPLISEQFKPNEQLLKMFNFPYNVNFKATDQSDWLNKAAEAVITEAETLKYQKGWSLKKCDKCKLSIKNNFESDFNLGETCVNMDVFTGKKWTCTDTNAYAILVNTYGTSDYNEVLSLVKQMSSTRNDSEDNHNALVISAIATAFIPVVGPYISAAFGIADAALYYKEGDNFNAGLALMMETIPLWGPALKFMRGGLKITRTEGKTLARKLKTKELLTPKESKVLKNVADESVESQKLYKSWLSKQLAQSGVADEVIERVENVVVSTTAIGKEVGKVEGAKVAYERLYQATVGASFASAQKWFLSDKSLEDNTKLQQALESGWKPGQPVPEKFRTKTYQQDIENLNSLNFDSLDELLKSKTT